MRQELAFVQETTVQVAEQSELEARKLRQDLLTATFDLECSQRLAKSQAFDLDKLQRQKAYSKQGIAQLKLAFKAREEAILDERNQLLDDADSEMRNLRAELGKLEKDKKYYLEVIPVFAKQTKKRIAETNTMRRILNVAGRALRASKAPQYDFPLELFLKSEVIGEYECSSLDKERDDHLRTKGELKKGQRALES